MRVLRLLDGRTVREIGEVLHLSANGVHQHLRGARDDGLAETDGTAGGWRTTRRGDAILRALRGVGL